MHHRSHEWGGGWGLQPGGSASRGKGRGSASRGEGGLCPGDSASRMEEGLHLEGVCIQRVLPTGEVGQTPPGTRKVGTRFVLT